MVEIKAIENNAKIIDIDINEKVSNFIENHFKEDVNYFEKKNKIKINFIRNKELNLSEYSIVLRSKSKKIIEKIEKLENLQKIILDNKKFKVNTKKNLKNNFKKRKFKKKKFVKKKT